MKHYALLFCTTTLLAATAAYAADDASGLQRVPFPPPQPQQTAAVVPPPAPPGFPPGVLPPVIFHGKGDLVITTQTAPPPLPFPPGGFITSPAGGEILSTIPPAVSITLSRPVVAEQSYIRIVGGRGGQVNDGGVEVTGTTMSVPLNTLPAGQYRVEWHAEFASGTPRTLDNSFDFTVPRHHVSAQAKQGGQ